MNNETGNRGTEHSDAGECVVRREALLKMGRFAAYAAPFTVLALTNKAEAATGHGPGKGDHGGDDDHGRDDDHHGNDHGHHGGGNGYRGH